MKRIWKLAIILSTSLLFLIFGCKQEPIEPDVELKWINITNPAKTTYLVGQQLDTKGLIVEAVYSDKTRKDVTTKSELSGFDSSTPGTKEVTVSYTENGITKKESFYISVSYELTLIEIKQNPVNTEFLVNEPLHFEGMVVMAVYSGGRPKIVTSLCKYEGFDSSKPTAEQTVTIKYTENDITKTAEVKVSVRERKNFSVSFDSNGGTGTMDSQSVLEKEKTIISKNSFVKNTDGTNYYIFDSWNTNADGSGASYKDNSSLSVSENTTLYAQWKVIATKNGDYIEFGEWPQTIKADTVTVNEQDFEEHGMFTYYKGSDGEWYVKQAENACEASYTYSDGTSVLQDGATYKYFKVEPIKWCVLTNDFEYNKTNKPGDKAILLLAADILTASVPYYEERQYDRFIDDKTVYSNNYKHSQIRAYLNGLSYQGEKAEQTMWNNKGFLQTAFTNDELSVILTTEADNDGESTTDTGKNLYWANGKKADGITDSGYDDFTCENTNDKIFLLSEQEVTTTEYGFSEYNISSTQSTRLRIPTDFAKANNAKLSSYSNGGVWWLRSPDYFKNNSQLYIDFLGNAKYVDKVDCAYYGIVPALSIKLQ